MSQAADTPDWIKIFKHIFIVAGVLLLPGLQHGLFAWLYIFIPLLVFYYLCKYGRQIGGKYLLFGVLSALLTGLILQMASQIVLGLTLIPTGLILARSAAQGDTPSLAGIKGCLVLGISWFLLYGGVVITEGSHPYSTLLVSVNQGVDEALKLYQEKEKPSAESFYLLTQAFSQIKERLIQLMPAILTSIVLFTVWLTMVLGNRLLSQNGGQCPWPEYQYWQLPEKLVWSVIGAAILAVLPIPAITTIGFNLLLIVSIIYCFQGLSIVLFFLNKWKVPLYIRSLFYVMIVFQSLGTIFLSVIGLADVWFDLRRSSSQDSSQENRL